jgi:hypothetical protein
MARSLIILAASALLALGALSHPTQAENSQNAKMTSCNADAKAKNLTGDDRKAFMKSCLSAHPATSGTALNSQQQKMKTCNADASTKKLTGADRKKYMSDCLKASP